MRRAGGSYQQTVPWLMCLLLAEGQLTLRHTYPDSDGVVHFMAFPPPPKVSVLPPNAVPLEAVLSELLVIFFANPLAEPPHMSTLYRLPMLAGNSSTVKPSSASSKQQRLVTGCYAVESCP